jgi:hypothetical protein
VKEWREGERKEMGGNEEGRKARKGVEEGRKEPKGRTHERKEERKIKRKKGKKTRKG